MEPDPSKCLRDPLTDQAVVGPCAHSRADMRYGRPLPTMCCAGVFAAVALRPLRPALGVLRRSFAHNTKRIIALTPDGGIARSFARLGLAEPGFPPTSAAPAPLEVAQPTSEVPGRPRAPGPAGSKWCRRHCHELCEAKSGEISGDTAIGPGSFCFPMLMADRRQNFCTSSSEHISNRDSHSIYPRFPTDAIAAQPSAWMWGSSSAAPQTCPTEGVPARVSPRRRRNDRDLLGGPALRLLRRGRGQRVCGRRGERGGGGRPLLPVGRLGRRLRLCLRGPSSACLGPAGTAPVRS